MARELEAAQDQRLIQRLLSNYTVVEGLEYSAPERVIGPCWEYQIGHNQNGYCRISWRVDGHPTLLYVHRLSWSYHFDIEIPETWQVNHHCDNPCCMNPDHLFLGTQADNQKDMVDKGRGRSGAHRGEDNGMSKLQWFHVFWIRMNCRRIINAEHLPRYINGREVTLQQLSDRLDIKFGVSVNHRQISRILNNKSWVDPNWDPSHLVYLGKPEGWQESWGGYNA